MFENQNELDINELKGEITLWFKIRAIFIW